MNKSKSPLKRVNIINVVELDNGDGEAIKPGDRVMRTTYTYASKLVASGMWAFTTKSKLKSFINKDVKLSKNMRSVEVFQNITGETLSEKRSGNKTIFYLPTFKYKRPPLTVEERPVEAIIRHKIRSGFKRFRKNDPAANQHVTIMKTRRFNPTSKASKNWRQNNPKTLVNTGDKVVIAAF